MGTLIIMILLTALYVFLIAPGRKPKEKSAEFLGLCYAHRGLYTEDQSIPENSLSAFRNAALEGYAIELDVQLSNDGEAVVFHDESLRRMTGDRRYLQDLSLEKLKMLRLKDTEEQIPTLTEALAAIGGKVPVLVELKPIAKKYDLCQKVIDAFAEYDGLWCIESFDPTIVGWFKRHAPQVVRGVLTMSRKEFKEELKSPYPFLLSNVMANFIARPHFVAHGKGAQSISVRMSYFLGAAPFMWTLTDGDDASWYMYRNLSVIFEHFRPKPRFRRRKGEKADT